MYRIKEAKAVVLSKAILCVLVVIVFTIPLLWSGTAKAQQRFVTADIIRVVVDTEICNDPGRSFCSDTGSSGIAEGDNDYIVMLYVQVIDPRGNPITGLTNAAFAFTQVSNFTLIQTVPFMDCTFCFLEVAFAGIYRIALQPVTNWGSDLHVLQLRVFVAGTQLRSLVGFVIP